MFFFRWPALFAIASFILRYILGCRAVLTHLMYLIHLIHPIHPIRLIQSAFGAIASCQERVTPNTRIDCSVYNSNALICFNFYTGNQQDSSVSYKTPASHTRLKRVIQDSSASCKTPARHARLQRVMQD